MSKTLRKIVAVGAMAALTLSAVPTALATTSTYLMIENVTVDSGIGASGSYKVNSTLNSAITEAKVEYSPTANVATITKLPGNLPYIYPMDYLRNTTNNNYGAYLPLLVNVAVYDGSGFADLSTGTLQVDGKSYVVDPVALTTPKGQLARALLGGGLSGGAVTGTIAEPAANSVLGGAFALFELDVKSGTAPADTYSALPAATNIDDTMTSLDTFSTSVVKAAIIEMIQADAKYTAVSAMLNTADKATLKTIVEDVATAFIGGYPGTGLYSLQANYDAMRTAAMNKIKDIITNNYTAPSVAKNFVPVTVFHDMSINYTADQVHTISFTKGGKTYERAFTVKTNLSTTPTTTTGYTSVATEKTGINANNINAFISGGAVVFDFSQKDLLMTDTWGTASSAYKVWDRSNIDTFGKWVSLKDTVLAGHTAYMNANITLKNAAGTPVPAGTILTVTYKKYTTGTISNYYYTMGDNGLFPFQIGLEREDLKTMFDKTNYLYADISFSGSKDGVSYTGSFPVYTRATDRISVGSITFDAGTYITMQPGETKDINAVLGNASAYATNIEFASNDPGTLVVSSTGARSAKLVAVKAGYAVVTARSVNDNTTATLIVNVGGTAATPTPTPGTSTIGTFKVTTTSGSLNVRSGMSTLNSKIGALKKNTTFNGELNADGTWVKLNYNGRVGYVSSRYVMQVD